MEVPGGAIVFYESKEVIEVGTTRPAIGTFVWMNADDFETNAEVRNIRASWDDRLYENRRERSDPVCDLWLGRHSTIPSPSYCHHAA